MPKGTPQGARARKRPAWLLTLVAAVESVIACAHVHGGLRTFAVLAAVIGGFAALRVMRGSLAEARAQLARRVNSGGAHWSKRLERYLQSNPLPEKEYILTELPSHASSLLAASSLIGTAALWVYWTLIGVLTALAFVWPALWPHRGLLVLILIVSLATWITFASWRRKNSTVVSTTVRVIMFHGRRREPVVILREQVRHTLPETYPLTRVLSLLRIMGLPTGSVSVWVGDAAAPQVVHHVTDPYTTRELFDKFHLPE